MQILRAGLDHCEVKKKKKRKKSMHIPPLPPLPLYLCTDAMFLSCSGKVAKEVVEASSKIQREPPEVHR